VEVDESLGTQGSGHNEMRTSRVVFPAIAKQIDGREHIAFADLQGTPLARCIPRFYGVVDRHIVMENLIAELNSPCLAYLKIGARRRRRRAASCGSGARALDEGAGPEVLIRGALRRHRRVRPP